MKNFFTASLLLLVVSCSGTIGKEMPDWRWDEPETPAEPEVVEAHPEITALGWSNVTSAYSAVPEGIDVYKSPGALGGVKAIAYIAVADPSKITWDVASINDPAIQGTTEELKTPSAWFKETAAPVVVNGGYFFAEGGKRYNTSVAVSHSKTYGVNINYASLDWETMYYPTRGVFYQKGQKVSTGWTYWTGGSRHYLYEKPAANSWEASPLEVPNAHFPAEATDFAPETAIGGGPVLLKGGQVVNSWKEELLYGDGADDKMPKARHPRTAIGVTKDGFLVLFVCEGRGMTEGVAGMTFAEEAAVLKDLGCTEALNLDGGGSSCLLVQGAETIKCSDGSQRAVSSVIILNKK